MRTLTLWADGLTYFVNGEAIAPLEGEAIAKVVAHYQRLGN